MTTTHTKLDGIFFILKNKTVLTLVILVLPAMLMLSTTSANAGWRGGYFKCAKTEIIDVRPATITEGAVALGLSTLAAVLPFEVAELLDSSEGITVLAPTDEAFENIPPDLLTLIASDPDILTAVLSYHVVPKEVDPRKVRYIRKYQTLAGQTLFASGDRRSPMVNQSEVDCQGYRTANGLVWVVDSVLLPQF
ncbi:MAG: fasciclin domain-containing protein [Candidatus Thiodiazotropha endolucinida]|nr:fasciclin domain-containing protein [Candidatus Thiodiazotropha taylori]MCG8092680.1 fasciclin domain-containing protein [Candidatus Thiodiazotropha endolucinida]MCG8060580.1 fasciclin domain-containing protein [Candidatus Thiodiazotropha taylori]MCG8064964.1 fasciclin domain-containing protein [Candidatus Thiodiazotropha taylori]MCW4331055.1 fasciclin domain-containing protein [Candidatus Thiodiazotropha endolucinida]